MPMGMRLASHPRTRKQARREVRYTADGGALGVGAGSTISGYEIAGIGHGVHMCLVSLSRFGLSPIGLRAGLCAASAVIQRKSYALDAVPGRSSPGHRCRQSPSRGVAGWSWPRLKNRLLGCGRTSSMSVGVASAPGGRSFVNVFASLNAPRAALSTHIAGRPFRL